MAQFKVYIKIYDKDGEYEADFRDITKHVQKLGDITVDTDSTEFQIGVYRTSNVSIQLNNQSGIFSDVGQPTSMFKYKRADSIVKITFDAANDWAQCGTAIVGEAMLSEEVDVFKGLLNDDSAVEDAKTESMSFQLLGYETLFEKDIVPFADLSASDTISEILFACLNQDSITAYLTIDIANLDPGLDQETDAVAALENMTVKEALQRLLTDSNSVLYIKDDTVYVKSRDATASLMFTFYGQAALLGNENIEDIKNISTGLHRVFNFITWKDTTLDFAVNSSIHLNGIRKKEVSSDLFTDTTKRRNILESIADEFGQKRQEFDLTSSLNYDTLAVNLLDRVSVDYPTQTIAWENNPLPVCGAAICGEAVLPRGLWALMIRSDKRFKILKKTISTSKQLMTFKLREIET